MEVELVYLRLSQSVKLSRSDNEVCREIPDIGDS